MHAPRLGRNSLFFTIEGVQSHVREMSVTGTHILVTVEGVQAHVREMSVTGTHILVTRHFAPAEEVSMIAERVRMYNTAEYRAWGKRAVPIMVNAGEDK
jgi:hypothetical protein